MVNDVFVDDKKIKDILTYINGIRHSEQIRMMFLCSFNGLRSINFAYLQVKDIYTAEFKVKDAICLNDAKNKGQALGVSIGTTSFEYNKAKKQRKV